MLKRYQVLLSDWMEEYIKLVAEKYDLSSSAVIRTHLCIAILHVIHSLYTDYKPDISNKELQELSKKASENKLDEEEVLRAMSKVLFEARKAVEYRLAKGNRGFTSGGAEGI
jgi:hypothetical protein